MSRVRHLMLALGLCAVSACGLLADLGPERTLALADAGDGAALDGSTADGGCVITNAEARTDAWSRIGSAQVRGTYMQLTADAPNQAGAVLWTAPTNLDEYELSFETSITSANDAGFGSGIAFVALNTLTPTCAVRRAVCVLEGSQPGYAVVIPTTDWGDGKDPPFLAIVDVTTQPIASTQTWTPPSASTFETPLATVNDQSPPPETSWRSVRVVAKSNSLRIYVDGALVLSGTAPAGQPTHWGFAGSTDQPGRDTSQRNAIRHVTLRVPGACP